MHFKRGKPKDKKLVEWGTPKQIQPEYWKESKSSPSKKPRNFCTKLKGRHDFVLFKRHEGIKGLIKPWNEYHCSACGKKSFKDIGQSNNND